MPLSKIPSAGFQDNVKFRNILINGDMSVSQRSTSVTGITGNGYHTVDRFRTSMASLGTWTMSQSTDVPSGQGFSKSLKLDCTTADASPSASDEFKIETRFEGQNLQYLKKGTSSAESLTLSFWVKSSKTGTHIAELEDSDNSRAVSLSYTVNTASTWEKKTITFPADTTGTLDNDNAMSLRLHFWIGAGSNFTSGTLQTTWSSITNANRVVGQVNLADSTSNEWYITGVQLEAGTTASDFEFLPHDVNLQRCQRYLMNYTASDRVGFANSVVQDNADSCHHQINFPVSMRTSPSMSVSNLMVTDRFTADNNVTGIYTIISDKTSAYFVTQQSGGLHSSFADRNNLILAVRVNTTGFLRFSAEL